MRHGISMGDALLVGEGATISSLANQTILRKPQLSEVQQFGVAVGALGVNVAYSCTVLGLLLDARRGEGQHVYEEAGRAFPYLEASYLLRLVGGGTFPL